MGKSLGIENIGTSLNDPEKCEMLTRQELIPSQRGTLDWFGPKYQQTKTDKFLSAFGVMYVIENSKKDKGKALKDHILKNIVPRGLDARIEEIQEKHQQAIEEKGATIALLIDYLKNCKYENVGLQGKIRAKDRQIAALRRCCVCCFSDEDKNNEISIIAKNNEEAEYPSICVQHGYRRHKIRMLLTRNKGSTLFADRDTPNATVTYNFWREYRLIVVDFDWTRHFRLDTIRQEQLLALNDK